MAKFQTKTFSDITPIVLPRDASGATISVNVEFPTAVPGSGDLIEVCKLPIGCKCVDWALVFPDIDTGGSPSLAFSLGVENTGGTDLGSEVWGASLVAGQTGAVVRNTTSASAQGDVLSNRNIALKVTAAAATYAGAGKIGQLVMTLVG